MAGKDEMKPPRGELFIVNFSGEHKELEQILTEGKFECDSAIAGKYWLRIRIKRVP